MPKKNIYKNESGFSFIELMIVLAIAGFILGTVLLALPSLQRSNRNNQRKQDANAVLQAISRWELNNSGNIPHLGVDDFLHGTKLFYFEISDISLGSGKGVSTVAANTNLATLKLYNYQRCDPANPGKSVNTGAGYHDIVALFALETSGAVAGRCQQL
jgi:prepilin-type N-terminal cleavage/methylation domain-containing protein